MMSIYEAMMRLCELNNSIVNNPLIDHNTRHKMSEAIDLAQGALKTIEDGQYMKRKLNAVYGKMVKQYADTDSIRNNDIDLKTLYENITMYYTKHDERYRYPIDQSKTERIEYWHREGTPLTAVVVWQLNKVEKIKEISIQVKES